MPYLPRRQARRITQALARDKSVLLLGPRQTGKTTLAARLANHLTLSFLRPDIRQRYEKNPAQLTGEVETLHHRLSARRPLVILDEIQKVPVILDVVQDLIDRQIANFVLTGSSARSLRRRSGGVNMLPGRVVVLRLDPLLVTEAPPRPLEDWLLYGALPGVIMHGTPRDHETDLESYVTAYLEEEVRAEAIVRNLGAFARFLEYAAAESGQLVNLWKLSQEIGVAHTTIAAYYQILEDCLIAERVDPLSTSKTRRRLTRSPKYLFFDLGVRRLAAREDPRLPRETMAALFEQFVGLELVRAARLSTRRSAVRFWRDPDGPEVDWVIDQGGQYTPVEVKWTDTPSRQDVKHLLTFMKEYRTTKTGYVVCRAPRPMQLDRHIVALPWQAVDDLIL